MYYTYYLSGRAFGSLSGLFLLWAKVWLRRMWAPGSWALGNGVSGRLAVQSGTLRPVRCFP